VKDANPTSSKNESVSHPDTEDNSMIMDSTKWSVHTNKKRYKKPKQPNIGKRSTSALKAGQCACS